ncbi:MAG: DUF3187 family protein [Woeseiaceae bacterium]|nr:DUF3187 family protein [Woeseiaceae bacterium]
MSQARVSLPFRRIGGVLVPDQGSVFLPVNSIAGRAAFLLLAAGGLPADAMGAGALADTDLNPLTVVFGFPDSTEGATLRPDGQHGLSLTLASASHNVESLEANERLAFDGETSRLAMAWRYGVSDRLELGGEVSYLWHHSGNLDSLIDDWHDFFGLPNGPRDRREQDQLDFSYLDDQGSSVNLPPQYARPWRRTAHGRLAIAGQSGPPPGLAIQHQAADRRHLRHAGQRRHRSQPGAGGRRSSNPEFVALERILSRGCHPDWPSRIFVRAVQPGRRAAGGWLVVQSRRCRPEGARQGPQCAL